MELAVLQLVIAVLGVVGAAVAGAVSVYVAMKSSAAVLDSRVSTLETEVKLLREWRRTVAEESARI